jgi:bacterioferritin (cytochrome b1)
MPTKPDALLNLLRCELDATNQQFVHILTLKLWGKKEAVARITEVDNIDFVNAMRIVDYLVAAHTSIELPAGICSPGTDYDSILTAERSMEARLSKAIEGCDALGKEAQSLVEAARAPRQAYAGWLDDNIANTGDATLQHSSLVTATADLCALLLTLIEQSMIHAFVHWHADDRIAADAAWATSGAAMMHMTRLVQLFARLPGVPVPGACPVANVQNKAADTLDADLGLARLCSRQAFSAADQCEHEAISQMCSDIGKYYQSFSCWQPQTPHPAKATNPVAFHSFEATLAKFLD